MTPSQRLDERVKIFLGKEADLPDSSRHKIAHLLTLDDIAEIVVLPDVHSKPDNPFPTGIVTLTRKTIYPSAIGQEIGCGMRVVTTELDAGEFSSDRCDFFFGGMKRRLRDGKKNAPYLTRQDYEDVLLGRYPWRRGGLDMEKSGDILDDISRDGVKPRSLLRAIPKDALRSGFSQIGSLGGGNHFLEIQVVREILDPALAEKAGLKEGRVILMFHTGSLTISKRLDNYYGIRFEDKTTGRAIRKKWRKLLFHFNDGRLTHLAHRLRLFFSPGFNGIPAESQEGRRYRLAFRATKNYSHANRAIISQFIKESLEETFGRGCSVRLLSDANHETIDQEEFGGQKFWVHRNGATRISHGCLQKPEVIPIPSFMGGPTFFCLPGPAIADSRFSVNHGVGRTLTKQEAKIRFSVEEIHQQLRSRNIRLYKLGGEDLREQAPHAFKDIHAIIPVLENHRLMRPVAVTHPLAILKG